MANIKSAIKRVNVTEKKTMQNKMVYSGMQTSIKKFRNAIRSNDAETAEKLLPAAFSEIDSAVSKGVIHKNNGARRKSRLSCQLRDLKSGKLVIVAKVDTKARAAQKAAERAAERDRVKAEALERREAKEAAEAKPSRKEKADAKAEAKAEKRAKKAEAKADAAQDE